MEAIHGMKIFAMSDEDWYVAPTAEEALAEYSAEMCATEAELREGGQLPSGYPRELSEADIDRMKIRVEIDPEDEDVYETRTFREHLTVEPPLDGRAEMFCSVNY